MQVLITRTNEDNISFRSKLESAGFDVLEMPCLEFCEPEDNYAELDAAIRKNHEYEWLFFLSQQAAKSFFERLITIGGNLFNIAPHLKIACVGDSTKRYIEETINFPVNFTPSIFNSEQFAKEFIDHISHSGSCPQYKILLPRTKVKDKSFVESLSSRGLTVHEALAYNTRCPEKVNVHIQSALRQIESNGAHVCLTSSAICLNFRELSRDIDTSKLKFITIGPKTSKTCKELFPKNELIEAETASIESMIDTLKSQQ